MGTNRSTSLIIIGEEVVEGAVAPKKTSVWVWVSVLILSSIGLSFIPFFYRLAGAQSCEQPGWFPTEFGLMDHSIFWFDGYYYLVSIHLYPDDRFAYARSTDLCNWENLSPVLGMRNPGSWDEMKIWSPFVTEQGGTYFMFYTGVTSDFTQSILLATSTNPANPDAWQPRGLVFQPNHEGMIWQPGVWADCRDPMVIEENGHYYLFYTGLDEDGAIIGVAEANSLLGSWQDQGKILLSTNEMMFESPTMVQKDNNFYLFYNEAHVGEKFHVGPTPFGPWGNPQPLYPGWAHEIWQNQSSEWFTSYLTDQTVSIMPLYWETYAIPPLPFIGDNITNKFLPFVLK